MPPHRWDPRCSRPADLVAPRRIDSQGKVGPIWRTANGRGWDKVAHGLYVPASRPPCVEQRILEQAGRLRPDGSSGCVAAWAALRWRGANFFDGLDAGGLTELPVSLVLGASGSKLRPWPGSIATRRQLDPVERTMVAGVPVTTVQRALYDEVVRRDDVWSAVQAIEMAAAAELISVWLFGVYVGNRNSRNGVPLVRQAVSLACDESRSPRETWLRLVWELVAVLPPPLVNVPVYDLDGRLLGVPDLFDPVAGLVGEYDGAEHKDVERHRKDVSREQGFRNHGLEYFTVVQGDSRIVAGDRIRAARNRAKFLPPESCAWTLERPHWDPAPETLDQRLERLGLHVDLTRG